MLSHEELVAMELAVSVTIRQFLFHLYCASKFEAPGYAGVSSGESLFGMPNNKFRARLWLVGHQMLLSRQLAMAVGVGVWIRATIRQVGKQVPLVVVRADYARFLFQGVYLKTNSQACGHAY